MPTLLLVEDDIALAALLEEYLNSEYDLVVLNRGDDALRILEEQTFDIILTDLMLPGADGLAILRQTCGDPITTLILLMTGYSGIEDALHAIQQGAYDFVSKPFQLPEIKVRLNNAARYQCLLREMDALKEKKANVLEQLTPTTSANTEQVAVRAYRSSDT
ncbi:MAG: response regulator [Mariprofundaceae bacterium]